MNAYEKARDYFMKEEAGLCDVDDMDDKPQYPLQLDDTLDLAIREAKKEVFDDIWQVLDQVGMIGRDDCAKLKKRHLPTFQKKSDIIAVNSDSLRSPQIN